MDEIFELEGLRFRAETVHDDMHGAPWEEHDGHGPVREVRGDSCFSLRPRINPGERFLWWDRGEGLAYDVQGATRLALKDGWGISDKARAILVQRLGRGLTKREIAAEAAAADYWRLRRYCEGDWYFCGVVVTLLDVNGDATEETDSLWGIESDAGDYLDEVARELAGEIAARVGDARTLVKETRIREG